MSLNNLSASPLGISERQQLVSRYQQLRQTSKQLNSVLLRGLPKRAVDEAGTKLGMLKRGKLVFDSESEMAILFDYALHDVRSQGRNRIEQFLIDSPPDPDSDELVCLRAMESGWYSLFAVESVEPGMGVSLRDLRSQQSTFIVDLGFASSARPGLIMAMRAIPFDGFVMSSGASLPAGIAPREEQDRLAQAVFAITPQNADGSFDPAPIIRRLLESGRSENIVYQDEDEQSAGAYSRVEVGQGKRVGRNSPCPCGSGRKFKHCCIHQH